MLENLQHQFATWEPAEQPVEFGNMAVFDVESTVEDKPFINQKGAQYTVIKDQEFPAPGFSEQLVGMKSGETKEFKITMKEDDPDKEVAGKEASFKVEHSQMAA